MCYFNTDGAPSHFKNKFTMQSLFEFKITVDATTIVWETCAPGHGKDPWDGIRAVIKRFLRLLEKHNVKLSANGARDVFCALLDRFIKHKVGSSVSISDFVFHYILSPGEPPLLGRANVWSAIVRPSTRPTVTAITGIRSSFCFRVVGDNVLAVRELSCRCASCLEFRWNECSNTEVGDWRHVTMTKVTACTGTRTRSQRDVVSRERRTLAEEISKGELIAMESAEDPNGFSFWLARAEGPAFQHAGPRATVAGRTLIPGGWYINVCYFDRFPPTSPSTFKLNTESYTENTEGVIARNVAVVESSRRRSRRLNARATLISLSREEIQRLEDMPSLDSM